jgi:hypothetical protein
MHPAPPQYKNINNYEHCIWCTRAPIEQLNHPAQRMLQRNWLPSYLASDYEAQHMKSCLQQLSLHIIYFLHRCDYIWIV